MLLRITKQIHYPRNLWIRKIIPIFYIISAEIYNYPFWLQDLSHLPLFFLLTWFSFWIICKRRADCTKPWNLKVMLFSISYAIFNELIQSLIPDRFPSLGDLIMNLGGVLAALIIYRFTCRLKYFDENKC